MSELLINDLSAKSQWLRNEVFEMSVRAGQGHLASALSQIDIVISLYYGGLLRFTKGDPKAADRDRVIVSKGHATMSLYPVLADLGYFPKEELDRYGKPEGLLRIFGNTSIPGIEATSGSLGHGPGIACGMCMAAKKNGEDHRTFVILSEGEMYEGSVWESAIFAAHNELDNLVVVIDRNRKIILGDTEDMMKLEPVEDKWRAFGWETFVVDGHSHEELISAFAEVGKRKGKPIAIIANTTKGKGISYMEGSHEWHYLVGNEEQIIQARAELEYDAKNGSNNNVK